jgi:hypothetical protein
MFIKHLDKAAALAAMIALLILLQSPAESSQKVPLTADSTDNGEDYYLYLPIIYKPCPLTLAYRDDFSDPDSGWFIFENDNVRYAYVDGEYQLVVKVKNSTAGLTGTSEYVSEYRLAVDVRNATGIPGQYGLLFDFSGWTGGGYDFYTFVIGPSGDYYVYHYHAASAQDPRQVTLLTSGWSASIYTGSQTNHLEIIRRSGSIDLYANGQHLASMARDMTGWSKGLFARSSNVANLDARFDNFEVYAPQCYGGETATPAAETAISDRPRFMLK